MSDIYLNPLNDEVIEFLPLLPSTTIEFINSSGKKQVLFFYSKKEVFDFAEERKLIDQNKIYLFSKDTIRKLEIIEEDKYKRIVLNDKFFFKLDKKNFSKMSDFFFKINMGLKNGWENINTKSDKIEEIQYPKNIKSKKGGIGCLVIIAAIIGFVIYAYSSYEPSPLQKIFKENDLGLVENVTEESWKTTGKNMLFKTRKITYRAYVEEDGTPYQIFVGKGKSFPIYDVSSNDTVIDDKEKKIIKNMEYFWEKSVSSLNGKIKPLEEDIKKHLNFPETYEHKDTAWFDLGKKYIINIKFISKNAFGVPIESVAKYEVNFETNTFDLIEIL